MVNDDLIEIAQRERCAQKRHTIRCCLAAGCMSSNSKGVKEALESAVAAAGQDSLEEVRGDG